MFITTCSMCRVTFEDEGITRIKGLSEVIVECGTHILVMPSSKGIT
jgi:hypothetical protein